MKTDNFKLYLESRITADDLLDRLESKINENIITDFKSFLDKGKNITESVFQKISDWILKQLEVESYVFEKIIENLKRYSKKIFELILAVLKRVKDFKEKYPKLFKAVIIVFTILLIILITAVVAYSQTTGQPVSLEEFGIDSGMLDANKQPPQLLK